MPLSFLTPVQVIIFDCDGVLFDSRKSNQFFYNQLLTHFGKPPLTEAALHYVHMHTVTESVEFLFRDGSLRDQVDLYRQNLDYTSFFRMMEMEPGLLDFLAFIRPWAKTAISTNRTTTIGPVLTLFSLDPWFDLVVSALDVDRPKPDPESIYKIMSYFKVGPEECLFIGDSEVDAQTALSAGVPLVAYKNEELTAALHVGGFSELTDAFKKNNHLFIPAPLVSAGES
ncbi:MAG: HAD family hydrolase [Deltaproteobacteria bacterium]|nr:HAD family hydrolase [Deltaproteobacteria bacterium]